MKHIDHEYVAEEVKIDFALMLDHFLRERKMSRSSFAELTGKNVAYISRVMGGNANLTIETMATLLAALGEELRITSDSWLKKEYYHVISSAFNLAADRKEKMAIAQTDNITGAWVNLSYLLQNTR